MEIAHATPTLADEHPEMYYSGVYWNSYEYVFEELNTRVGGGRRDHWFQHFHKQVGGRRFKKALILCCGNGWVERAMYEQGMFEEAVGVDYVGALLDHARAASPGWPLRYYQMDINTAAFPEGGFDLIVNHAAAHHITALDHVFRTLAALLPDDGYFVSFDYVGPHRNQYPLLHWAAVHELNDSLPPQLRQELAYPHLPTMIAGDPTEAVHSELIVPVMRRYFAVEQQRHVGGALAYPLLTHNQRFFDAPEPERDRWLRRIMAADAAYVAAFPESSLFDYLAARPARAALADRQRLALWSADEERRERLARQHGGRYHTSAAEYGLAPAPAAPLPPDLAPLVAALRRECAWRRETMEHLLADRDWLRLRLSELEPAWRRVDAHPLAAAWRTLRRALRRS
ncbi:MAG TPA: class I SAM-dependent methyltransferase [Herpetosiphonaceae bacterium]